MKIYVDNKVLKEVVAGESFAQLKEAEIEFPWPSLLAYLGQENLFANFPEFNDSHPLFNVFVEAIKGKAKPEEFIYLYDQLFAETLSALKNLPIISSQFFLEALNKESPPPALVKTVAEWQDRFLHHPKSTLHDLMLFLGWDRVSVALATLFEYPFKESHSLENLEVLKDCLMESFDHITADGKSKPSLFRLMEASWAFKMRDEFLQNYSEDEWKVISQSAPILQPRDKLPDIYYIDENQNTLLGENIFLTSSTPEKVRTALKLADLIKPGYVFDNPKIYFNS